MPHSCHVDTCLIPAIPYTPSLVACRVPDDGHAGKAGVGQGTGRVAGDTRLPRTVMMGIHKSAIAGPQIGGPSRCLHGSDAAGAVRDRLCVMCVGARA
jgi:hypothetical protein